MAAEKLTTRQKPFCESTLWPQYVRYLPIRRLLRQVLSPIVASLMFQRSVRRLCLRIKFTDWWRGLIALFLLSVFCSPTSRAATIVRFDTVMGVFDVQLFDSQMPRTVTNFLSYVDAGKYDGTAVHRNSDTQDTLGGPFRDFVIQGGGFSFSNSTPVITYFPVVTSAPIADEPGGGVAGPSNVRGTIAMAKSGPNTATSQWFINQGDNSFLDSPTRSDGGFSAFGAVLGNGMTVVDAIGHLPLPTDFGFSIASPFNDLPLRNFSGHSITNITVANTVTVNSVKVLALPTGDVNRDGVVDESDLALLQTNLNVITSGALLSDGDVDMDGDVDNTDLAIWKAHALGVITIVNFTFGPATLAYDIEFASQGGKNYALQYATNLSGAANEWNTVAGKNSIPGSDTTTRITGSINDAGALNAKAVLFRIESVP